MASLILVADWDARGLLDSRQLRARMATSRTSTIEGVVRLDVVTAMIVQTGGKLIERGILRLCPGASVD